jgi:RimJ/RimL family protein N-acetyltransferase
VAQFRGVELIGLEMSTDRLLLRPWRRDDASKIVEIIASGALHAYLALPDPYTIDDAVDFATRIGQLERDEGTGLDSAMVERETGQLVGSVTLRLPHSTRAADIGYWVAQGAQGRGYATEATDALARWAFQHRVYRVEVRIDVANAISARVALRAGFAFEGVRRGALGVGAARHDMGVFVRTLHDSGQRVAAAFPALPASGLTDGVLCLRVPQVGDLPAFAEQEEDPRTVAVGVRGAPKSREAMAALLARSELDWLVGRIAPFALIDRQTGRFAGSLHLRPAGPPHVADVGFVVHPAFRGRGYATRALRLVSEWAFTQADFVRLELGTKRDNLASQRAAMAAGFTQEGIATARLRNGDDSFSDELRYGLINPKYR